MADPDTIRHNGRTYITIREAARLVSYSETYLYACCRRGKLSTISGNRGRIYVSRSDLLRFVEQQQQRQSKWRQIGAWWRDHPQDRASIRDGKQLQRLLAQAGIRCSLACVRGWLARYAPRQRPVHVVLAWLEADGARRQLSIPEARRELFVQRRLTVHPSTIRRAWKKYDAAHEPPPDPALYQAAKEAAAQFGVSRTLITHAVRQGKLTGIRWKQAMYVRRADIQQRFGAHWLKRGRGRAMIHDWYQAHPAYLNRTLPETQRAFYEETGIRLSQSLFSRVRKLERAPGRARSRPGNAAKRASGPPRR